MSVTRRFALVLIVAVATVALSAASVLAQGGSPNPSGGTRLTGTINEGTGSVSIGGYLAKGLSIDLGLRAWASSYFVSRYFVPAGTRPVSGRALTAYVPRRVWGR
jgi:hypothetical protein